MLPNETTGKVSADDVTRTERRYGRFIVYWYLLCEWYSMACIAAWRPGAPWQGQE